MAKINAYGFHQMGPTYFVEADRGDEALTYAIRIRSDRMVQTRLVSVRHPLNGTHRRKTSFVNAGTLGGPEDQAEALRQYVVARVERGIWRIAKVVA